jgi:hypothetical protein
MTADRSYFNDLQQWIFEEKKIVSFCSEIVNVFRYCLSKSKMFVLLMLSKTAFLICLGAKNSEICSELCPSLL